MKKNNSIYILLIVVFFAACKKDFVDRPSLNAPTVETFYNTEEEVRGATAYLYNQPWYDFQDKAYHAIGEALGGNMLTETGPNYGSGVYNNFTVLSTDPLVASTWLSLYKVAGQAGALYKTLEVKKGLAGDKPFYNEGIAEARFIRGVAYFYLARIFGNIPIVDDPIKLATSGNYDVPKYIQSDVIRFAIEDFKAAEAGLGENSAQPGRVNKYSAKGMMAKAYLYLKDYANAKAKAEEVIKSGKFSLYPNYQEMFTSSKVNNNNEVLFALQWVGAGGYGFANPIQVYQAPSTLLGPDFKTGYSSVIPTLDLLRSYDPKDKRRQWSNMEHGFTKKEWTNRNFMSGFVYDTTHSGSSNDDATKTKNGSRANALKYIVGTKATGESLSDNGSSDINTYILRYADVLLIYAEAVLGDAASTADASALSAFNMVHNRGGNFDNVPVALLTKDIILKERRAEFAYEGDYWFDVQRQGLAKAREIISNQERGSLNWDGTLNSYKVPAANLGSEEKLFLPIPQQETVSNPKLLPSQPAVPYF